MFVDREQEIAFLNSLLRKSQPTAAQMILLYGRRRVGKTVLARHWSIQTNLPTVYWAAERDRLPCNDVNFCAHLKRSLGAICNV